MPAPFKTPGVFIDEPDAFANAVVEVATAVPAFIGYTERAVDQKHRSLAHRAQRISSVGEYLACFGGLPQPRFEVLAADDASEATAAAGPPPAPTDARGQVATVGVNGRRYRLSRAAGRAGGRGLLPLAMRHFFQNGGGLCYVVSVGSFDDEIDADVLIDGLAPLSREPEPTVVLTPDAVLLDEPGCIRVQQQVLAHCGGTMRNRIAIFDVWGGDRPRDDAGFDCIDAFRGHLGSGPLDFAAAYYPWLHTSLVSPTGIDVEVFGPAARRTGLAALLRADAGVDAGRVQQDARLKALGEACDRLVWTDAHWLDALKAEQVRALRTEAERAQASARFDADAADPTRRAEMLASNRQTWQRSLVAASPLYARLAEQALELINLMPPSGAMAGVYTAVDNDRGVWAAPANVALVGVVRPAVEVSQADLEALTTSVDGKSINAIRRLPGRGTLVWGARTLDGNSHDWRYISVRRTITMIEVSCRLAVQACVFEPNDANTWLTIQSMLSSYLTGVWKRGGLVGAVPEDAFSVQVGLGRTMTPQDIVDGILRVNLLVALTRPAEFIEVSFQQQMMQAA